MKIIISGETNPKLIAAVMASFDDVEVHEIGEPLICGDEFVLIGSASYLESCRNIDSVKFGDVHLIHLNDKKERLHTDKFRNYIDARRVPPKKRELMQVLKSMHRNVKTVTVYLPIRAILKTEILQAAQGFADKHDVKLEISRSNTFIYNCHPTDMNNVYKATTGEYAIEITGRPYCSDFTLKEIVKHATSHCGTSHERVNQLVS